MPADTPREVGFLGQGLEPLSHRGPAARAAPELAAKADEAYLEAQESGLGGRDFAAVIEPLATKSGLK